MNIRVDGFTHQQSPGEIMQDFWLMSSCSTTSGEAVGEACLLHKPGPAAGCHPERTTAARSCLARLTAATETELGHPKFPGGCHQSRCCSGTGACPANSWLEGNVAGRNPRACLTRAPFHALAIRLLLALLTGVFIVEEKFTGVGGWRGQSVRWGWREGAF